MASKLVENLGSTHDLLFRLLACEVGVLAPVAPLAQVEALNEAMPVLKKRAIEGLDGPVPVSIPVGAMSISVSIPGRSDGIAFAELYRGMELFLGQGTLLDDVAVSSVLQDWVYPLTGRRIMAEPAVQSAWLTLLKVHVHELSDAGLPRVLGRLKRQFRFPPEFLGALERAGA